MISFAFYCFVVLSILTLAIAIFAFCKLLIDFASYSDSLLLALLFVLSLISFIMSCFGTFYFYFML